MRALRCNHATFRTTLALNHDQIVDDDMSSLSSMRIVRICLQLQKPTGESLKAIGGFYFFIFLFLAQGSLFRGVEL